MNPHTPGPWHIIASPGKYQYNVWPAKEMVGSGTDRIAAVYSEGNAHLIASAPELLEVARAAFHALKSYEYGNTAKDLAVEMCDKLADVIAKAEVRP